MATKNEQQPQSGGVPNQAAISITKEDLVELVREMRRPDPEHEEKLRKEAEFRKQRALRRVRIAKADEEAKKRREAMCAHRKPNGQPSTGFSEYSNGRVQEMCLRCQKVIREFWKPEVAQGMALQKKLEQFGVTRQEWDEAQAGLEPVGVGTELSREPWQQDLTTDHH